ncbi:MmcQ/YjbR family DNA-binding protein [Rhodophyticola porphyridii]|nr:MmcQ/YjbR family DNA-binding protein [Rhodophyticola porphyridii]
MQTTLSAMFAHVIDTHCATLPGAVAEQPFGPDTQVWKVGGRMFAAHTRGANGVSVKCADGAAAQKLIQTRKAISAPYLKRGGWVMFLWENTPPEELRRRLTDSYLIVRGGLPCERQAELPPPPPMRGRAAGA